ncbi:MAG: hypothetical protein IT175_06260 [Acidobacteria bacterium]|nr:hypothetical protein [Acidobacteriota bacterium]
MKVLLTLDGRTASGGSPLIMHNERLADPLDDYTRAIGKIAKKRGKTDADHMEIGRLEFLGGLYANGNGPCLPAFNILRCLQDGAKRVKRGADVLRGVSPLVPHADLAYTGPRDPDEMWQSGNFALRKSVGVQRSRTMRTRPIFTDWSAVLPVEVDPNVFDPDTLVAIWRDAGVYAGIGDMRPIYGKFEGTATEWTIRSDDGLGEAAYALASAISAHRIQVEDAARMNRHGSVEELLKQAIRTAGKINKQTTALVGGNGAS